MCSTQLAINGKIHNTYYCKFYITNWFYQCFHWYFPNSCSDRQIMASIQPGFGKKSQIPIYHLFPQ